MKFVLQSIPFNQVMLRKNVCKWRGFYTPLYKNNKWQR
jgi:hypothetical protein